MSRSEVLAAVASGTVTVEQAATLLDALQPKQGGRLVCKVSEKGALSIYGLQRMPVTLYAEQWERLIDFMPEVKAFIGAQNGKLSRKG